MKRYTLYCTEEQTKKALELGAPIEHKSEVYYPNGAAYPVPPTAEQMILWLEEQYIYKIYIDSVNRNSWYFIVYVDENSSISNDNLYLSRKEATLAAIDAVLDHLNNNKK